uniref:Putative 19 kDa protein n=1 Tax=Grapevine virus A TaxID=35288 RepID=A0A1D8X831_9VIRU|nr:putative 19 kDa protein [Grapevine virus A]
MTSQNCTELSEFLGYSSHNSSSGGGLLESLSYAQCVSLLSDLKDLGYKSIDSILYILGGGEAERFEIYRIFRRHGIGIGEALQLGVKKSLSSSPRSTVAILDDLLSRLGRGGAFLPCDLGAVGGELIVTFHLSRLSVDLYINNKKVVTRTAQAEGDLSYVAGRFAGYKGLVLRASRH